MKKTTGGSSSCSKPRRSRHVYVDVFISNGVQQTEMFLWSEKCFWANINLSVGFYVNFKIIPISSHLVQYLDPVSRLATITSIGFLYLHNPIYQLINVVGTIRYMFFKTLYATSISVVYIKN